MTTIRATCPNCSADIELGHAGIAISIIGDTCIYRYDCPACSQPAAKRCQPNSAALLTGAGCATTVTAPPAELDEPRPDVGPISPYTKAAFRAVLACDAAIAEAFDQELGHG